MNRSAPVEGYDFGNKRQYRRAVWNTLSEGRSNIKNAHIILMPSSEGDEIKVAENHGFRQYHMHVVDRNPAIVAHLKRRFPHINTYGVALDEALWRIRKVAPPIVSANFDLCGPVGQKVDSVLSALVESDVMDAFGRFAITVLRGREQVDLDMGSEAGRLRNAFGSPFKHHSDNDVSRAWWPLQFNDAKVTLIPIRSEAYRSNAGHQTMLWTVYQIIPTLIANRFEDYTSGKVGLKLPNGKVLTSKGLV